MATEVKNVIENTPATTTPTEPRVEKAQQFWNKNSKYIVYGFAAIVLLIGGYIMYENYFKGPEEQKASEAMWRAEEFYRADSVRLALNGSGANQGFLKIISKYGGTKAGNLSRFYAGSCYMKMGDFNNAIKQLKEFSTGDELLQVRTAGLLGDAYAETGKKNDAADSYKKAGTIFEADNINSPEYLFRAGLLYETMGKNNEATEMYSIIKQKYPSTQRGIEIDKYLARLGKIK
ncbi:MAG: tetratricopeptide repeat protein [Chitinophagaceae bacterium]|nr:tetratricopeptide repeat protein [Chitinophagaceae bacterium]